MLLPTAMVSRSEISDNLEVHHGRERVFSLVPHSIQAREYLRGVATPRSGPRWAFEVPAEVLVGICGAVARAVGCLDGGKGLLDPLFRDALYLGAHSGDGRRLGREVAHDGKD